MEWLPLPWCEAEWQSFHRLRYKFVIPFAANLLRTENLLTQGKIADNYCAYLRYSNPLSTLWLISLSDLHSQLTCIHAHLFYNRRELIEVEPCRQALLKVVHELWNHSFSRIQVPQTHYLLRDFEALLSLGSLHQNSGPLNGNFWKAFYEFGDTVGLDTGFQLLVD